YQAGLFYTYENVTEPQRVSVVNYPSGTPFAPPIPNVLLTANTAGNYHEYAGFADATYYFTDALDTTVGGRYSYNRQVAVDTSGGPLGTGNLTSGDSSSDGSYLFDLRYRPTQQLSAYVRVASAYRPGGPVTVFAPGLPTRFGPDTDWDYEAGVKGAWLDRRLNADVAVYYVDWRNIQITTLFNGTKVYTSNGGNAKSEGVEFDGSYEPVHGLVFGANASFDEAVMTSVLPGVTASTGARVGDPLPYTPKWSGALTADYSYPLTPDLRGGVGGSWSYKSYLYSSFSADPLNTRVQVPSYGLFSVRAHMDWNSYSLIFNVNNVANKQTFSNVTYARLMAGLPIAEAFGVPVQPRTYRLTANVSF
ncbi:MAG: TonB-dependent receptor domain-containing protein, partial [Steroidobacteraceae bacterium]